MSFSRCADRRSRQKLTPKSLYYQCNSKANNVIGVQVECIAKGEAQKSPLLWRFSGFLRCTFLSKSSSMRPSNFNKITDLASTPCKPTCLYNAPCLKCLHTRDDGRNVKNATKSHRKLFSLLHPLQPFSLGLSSAPAEGQQQQQQQQLKTTSDVTSKFAWCCRASVL